MFGFKTAQLKKEIDFLYNERTRLHNGIRINRIFTITNAISETPINFNKSIFNDNLKEEFLQNLLKEFEDTDYPFARIKCMRDSFVESYNKINSEK